MCYAIIIKTENVNCLTALLINNTVLAGLNDAQHTQKKKKEKKIPHRVCTEAKANMVTVSNNKTHKIPSLPGVTYPGAAALTKAPLARAALPLPLAT